MSSQLAALLGPSSGAAASAASTSGTATLRSSLDSLLGTSSGGTAAGSNPFSALLQPVASTRSILSQLADAVEQANSVLAAPHWDDLLGGGAPCPALLCAPLLAVGWLACWRCKTHNNCMLAAPLLVPPQVWTSPDSSAPTAPCCGR